MDANSRWILSTYLMQGIPYALVTLVSPVLYKSLGLPNVDITFYTSLFIFPWIFKFFLAPALEQFSSKRNLILCTQFIMAVLVGFLAIILCWNTPFYFKHIIFILIALTSAIHDINSDGLYLEVLSYQAQAKFIGIRSLCYQVGRFLCQGGLVWWAGLLGASQGQQSAWILPLFFLTLLLCSITWLNQTILPRPTEEKKSHAQPILKSYQEVFHALKALPHIMSAVIFLLLYNTAEAQLGKILPLFMLDSSTHGGLGLDVQVVGIVYGGLGIGSMLLGITLSGFLLARLSLKKCLLPFTMMMSISNAACLLLIGKTETSLTFIIIVILFIQFSFGLASGAYMLYLINLFAKGTYSMSLYAIATGIMLLGIMMAGAVSGYLQTLLGYPYFFIWTTALSVFIILLSLYQVRKIL